MSNDPDDASAPPSQSFDVFRSDGSTRLPGQRFPDGEAHESIKRTGPVDQRVISDATGGPRPGLPDRSATVLRRAEKHEPALPDDHALPEPLTVHLQTYQVNLAERIARVKAEQQEALGNLQQLEEDSRDDDKADDRS